LKSAPKMKKKKTGTKVDPIRSAIMRAVRSKHTKPEVAVRSILRLLGQPYRLHSKALPGNPDIVLTAAMKVIFVHGCFWHGHSCARGARVPKTNRMYWTTKVARNRARDVRVAKLLRSMGWKRLVLWECELKNPQKLKAKLERFCELSPKP
jgi:DNA mismatch endonuclease (patch repair protein)